VTLTEFLAVRLDEAERGAKATARRYGPAWSASGGSLYDESNPSVHPGPFATGVWGDLDDEVAEHIVRHDPARALAEVEAKRQILDMCAEVIAAHPDADDWPAARARAGVLRAVGGDHMSLAEDVIAALALPYADHPDYQPEWRPETAAP
jgi:hypothetical protein